MLAFLLFSCSSMEESEKERIRKLNEKKEIIFRMHDDFFFVNDDAVWQQRVKYPWEEAQDCKYLKITKDYFRCKGSSINGNRVLDGKEYCDCDGIDCHGLPYKNGKEFVYPIMIDILNYIQKTTSSKVVITCGHRCPEHNIYSDLSKANQTSKHQIGAEVDFYVEGYEDNLLQVVKLIMQFYQDDKDIGYQHFINGVGDRNWHNNEIIIKFRLEGEGRDFDNRHPYQYITIEVKRDRSLNEAVNYNWNMAHNGYLRN